MKTTFLRTLLALGALVSATPLLFAQQGGSGFQVQQMGYGDPVEYWSEQQAGYAAMVNDPNFASYCQTCSCDGCSAEGCPCEGSAYEGCPCEGGVCCDSNYCGDCYESCHGMCYAELHNIFMRAHVSSDVVGKLREKYEYSPRLVTGYETAGGLGVRGRYWNYSRTTGTVDDNGSLGLDMNVIDIEGTKRISSRNVDVLLSGGFRWADMKIEEDNDDEVSTEMPGITFAIDGRAPICCTGGMQWSAVCGARWSLMGGDWRGDYGGIIRPTFDDNVTAEELYGGFEMLCHRCGYDLYARLVFEIQNWHSDALGESSPTDSIGFVGPAIQTGVTF